MASFLRFGVTRVLTDKLVQSTSKKIKYSVAPSLVRLINTSSKSARASADSSITSATTENKTEQVEYWQSHGFDSEDRWLDKVIFHTSMFVAVSLCLVTGSFIFAYQPDHKLVDWCQREAYLQIRYREDHNLPLIDPNYVDPSKIKLPSDEELGDTEIII